MAGQGHSLTTWIPASAGMTGGCITRLAPSPVTPAKAGVQIIGRSKSGKATPRRLAAAGITGNGTNPQKKKRPDTGDGPGEKFISHATVGRGSSPTGYPSAHTDVISGIIATSLKIVNQKAVESCLLCNCHNQSGG